MDTMKCLGNYRGTCHTSTSCFVLIMLTMNFTNDIDNACYRSLLCQNTELTSNLNAATEFHTFDKLVCR
jgi:hypothetical protein